jgi:hypothetical protein
MGPPAGVSPPDAARAGSGLRSMAGDTIRGVADDKIWTAAELEDLEPNDHRRLFNDRVVTDLSEVSPEFLERARSAARALLEARGVLGKTVG